MSPRSTGWKAVLVGALLGAPLARAASPLLARADDPRPSEDSIFGAPQAPATRGPETPSSAPDAGSAAPDVLQGRATGADRPGEDSMFGAKPREADQLQPHGSDDSRSAQQESGLSAGAKDQFETEEAKYDPLKVGGTLYLRTTAAGAEGRSAGQTAFSAPSLMDGYFDARPSDRVRGMMLARLRYDPTFDASAGGLPSASGATASAPANPSVALDQLWLRFDIARTVFITAGKQHVKWGASRFWNPTDFLTPERRDPLAPFDVRLGATMVKLHLPWEAKGWNFYALGLLDNAGPANQLGKIGGAARAEVVFGHTEVGLDAVAVKGRRPRYGLDISSALGPVDVYGEAALRSGADFHLWRASEDAAQPFGFSFEPYTLEGAQVQASGGANITVNYTEQNAVTIGAEYFYNPAGTHTPQLYPWLIFQNQYQPFYAGQHYAAIYALAASLPGSWNKVGLSLSNLANLSDLSFLTRVDSFIRVLSYLNVELYGAVHYGTRGGEFRFAFESPALTLGGQAIAPVSIPAPTFELGAGLRVSL